MDKYRGIMATTHVDKHYERVSREGLESIAEQINNHEKIQWVTWDHQTTLPPIAYVDKAWVEQLEDGEYGLLFEATALTEQENLVITEDIEITQNELDSIQLGVTDLLLSHDRRNFDDKVIQTALEELSTQFPTGHQYYARKSEFPQSVVWLVVVFIAGGVSGGFLNRIGEVLADKVIAVTGQKLRNIGEILVSLRSKTLINDKPDYIFVVPMQDCDVNVEGALESPDTQTIVQACEKLPELYVYARKLLSQNQKDYFSDLKFLFNPVTQRWEINFLTIRKTHQVVKSQRYYIPEHALRLRYDEQLIKIKELGKE